MHDSIVLAGASNNNKKEF